MRRKLVCLVFGLSLALAAVGCRDEGPAEEAGRKLDEAVEDLRHAGEGSMERAGRKMDEAADSVKESAEEMKKKLAGE